jgi:hypothetical protein
MSYRTYFSRRPKPSTQHLHAYGEFAQNFVRCPAYIQKLWRFVLFWRPAFRTETRSDGQNPRYTGF